MKSFKMLLAATAILTCAASVQAQTIVRITGSTAYRSAMNTAIKNTFDAGVTIGHTGSSFTGSSQVIFKGTVGGNAVIVETGMGGSVGGVYTVSNSLPVNFLADTAADSLTVGATTGSLSTGTNAQIPDVAMSDTFQNSTPFNTNPMTDIVLGIVPFQWITNNDAPLTLNNITPQLAQVLYQSGQVSLATFTGDPADNGKFVFGLGRDPDSGTRLTTFAESGVGTKAVVKQWLPTVSGAAITSHVIYPSATITGLFFQTGDNGYTSGGTLAGVMGKTSLANMNGFYIAYAGTSDAQAAVTAGGRTIKWNGIDYSPQAMKEGLYTFWGYEHLMYLPTIDSAKKTVADALAQQIITTDAPIKLSEMHVSRATDGGQVIQNY